MSVLLVGTFHLANPNLDLANPLIDDVLTEQRQAEIESVVSALLDYKPTVVALEWPVDRSAQLETSATRLDQLVGQNRSETVQLGMRLASRAHARLLAIDVMDDFWVDRIDHVVDRDPTSSRHFDALASSAERSARRIEDALAGASIGAVLAAENTPDARRAALHPYLADLIAIAHDDDYPGAEAAANWYRRNFKIAANLLRALKPGERAAVLFGAGHMPVLEHVLSANPLVELVDPVPFLVNARTQ